MSKTETLGDKAQRLLDVALDIAVTVRDESRDEITAVVRQVDDADRDALIVILAALVDVNQSAAQLLRWVTWDEDGRPLTPADQARIGAAEYARLAHLGIACREMPDWVRAGKSAVVQEHKHANARASA